MLENHGVIVIGNDAAEAWSRLYFLERACEVQILAQSTGQELIEVPDDIVQRTAEQSTHDQRRAGEAVRRRQAAARPGEPRVRALS